eukprot:PhF_6_TR619/c0_g1_i2/m.811
MFFRGSIHRAGGGLFGAMSSSMGGTSTPNAESSEPTIKTVKHSFGGTIKHFMPPSQDSLKKIAKPSPALRKKKGLRPERPEPDFALRAQLQMYGSDAATYHHNGKNITDHASLQQLLSKPVHNWVSLDNLDVLMRTFKSIAREEKSMARGGTRRYFNPDDDDLAALWHRAYGVIWKARLFTELEPLEDDPPMPGEVTWIDLDLSMESRKPRLWKLPGTDHCAIPLFSLEEYHFHFYQRHKIWDALWFPTPRNGDNYDKYNALPRPVVAYASFSTWCRLATTAYGSEGKSFCFIVNPCQEHTKILTYPEMTYIAQRHKTGTKDLPPVQHLKLYDTSLWVGSVVEESTAEDAKLKEAQEAKMAPLSPPTANGGIHTTGPVPHMAILELHILLNTIEVNSLVCITLVRTTRQTVLGQILGRAATEVLSVHVIGKKQEDVDATIDILKREWSFSKECGEKTPLSYHALVADAPPNLPVT